MSDFILKSCLQEQKKYFEMNAPFSYEFRRQELQRLHDVILGASDQIALALQKDLGKSSLESYMTETSFLLSEIKHALAHLREWMRPKRVRSSFLHFPSKAMIYPRAYGQVLIIAPWNYPIQLALSPLVGALAAGNVAVVRPSEVAPYSSEIVCKLLSDNFDPRLVVAAAGDVSVAKALLSFAFDYIFFTGSTAIGKEVYKAAAEHLTPVTLELGGKSPLFVDADVDIKVCARRIAWGKWMNAGQTCVAPDYLLVDRKVYDPLVTALTTEIKNFYGENPLYSNNYGRIVNTRHFDRLLPMLSSKVVYGGEHKREERYIAPTLLALQLDDFSHHPAMSEEIFGPILPILAYDKLPSALQLLKSPACSHPLAAYIFSSNKSYIQKIREQVNFGGGCINDTIVHLSIPSLPFGGVGASGIGSYHGEKSFSTFTHYQSLLARGTVPDIPLRYPPYSKLKESILRRLL
ncbi:MAG: aldehyde dehydrogenase [Oligoflexia bacterium]|nr:aldehyde dehydrogenase [Oligoflexia bacterium]MBF0366862.1 aldehyde dehydrogenase [Oligoflexia bacterium]